ncbi:hypothetical protein [Mycobacterium intracellulare]|nr:hypothetical protein [Mycobacterium intracellulare]
MSDVYVKVSDLKELVERWRQLADDTYSNSAKMSDVYVDCADDLEAIYLT